ncbi:MAG: glycosyltransferase [Candidatus Eremiobacteraeota bacterium]|nr:glycosyltransferase [Candidatus Eremiobacteraeota bacterium]
MNKKQITGYDILCLSTQDWDDLWTRKQRFMTMLARQNNRVLYVQQQMHWAGYIFDPVRQSYRLGEFKKPMREIEDNLYVTTLPLVIPGFQVFKSINRINNRFIGSYLKERMKELDFSSPVLWTYTPHCGDLIGNLGEQFVLYECVDEFEASKGLVKRETIRELETEVLKKADLVSVTAPALFENRKNRAKKIILVPNGAEVEHFAKATSPETPVPEDVVWRKKPVLGFIGRIAYWIDLELLHFIAREHPDWSVVLIGPPGGGISAEDLKGEPNFYWLGPRPYEELPGYLKGFDVCLNPYKTGDLAEGCSPLKLYEYLAGGCPVVSTDMAEARKFEPLVYVAGDYVDFISKIKMALEEETDALKKARMNEAKKYSWEARFKKLESVILDEIEFKSI